MTFHISNSPPPVEAIAAKNNGVEQLKAAPVKNSADEAEVSELSQAVVAALGPNEQKIEAFRRQIADGTYVVDPVKVIEKMLDGQIAK